MCGEEETALLRSLPMDDLTSPRGGPEMPRTLLVEDNPLHARLIKGMLGEAWPGPQHLHHVKRLDEALRYLQRNAVECVLLDLLLPDAQGLEAVHAVCGIAGDIPVVVLSAHDDEELALRAVEEGAQDYLVKGKVDADGLRRSMRYSIERASLADEHVPALAPGATSVGLGLLDQSGQFLAVDRGVCDVLGRDADEILASSLDLIDPDHRAAFDEALAALAQPGQPPLHLQVTFLSADWDPIPVTVRISGVYAGPHHAGGFLIQLARTDAFVEAVDGSSAAPVEQSWRLISPQ